MQAIFPMNNEVNTLIICASIVCSSMLSNTIFSFRKYVNTKRKKSPRVISELFMVCTKKKAKSKAYKLHR